MTNKREIVQYFNKHEESLAQLYTTRSGVSKHYLDKREDYKMATFTGSENYDQITDIYNEFKATLSSFSSKEMHDFIIITSVQDMMVFDRAMVKIITGFGNVIGSVRNFIIGQKVKYDSMLTQHISPLPHDIRYYITHSRGRYKRELYLFKKLSLDTFNTINQEYDKLLKGLDSDSVNTFVKALMYQDLKIICDFHLQNFN